MIRDVPHLSQRPGLFVGFMKMWYTVSSFGHTRRPVFRLINSSGSRNRLTTESIFVSFESASACASVRGNPSRMNPFFASGSLSRRSVIAITRSSGTSPPAPMYAFAFFPRSDPAVTLCRKMSPVETWGTPRYAASFVAGVGELRGLCEQRLVRRSEPWEPRCGALAQTRAAFLVLRRGRLLGFRRLSPGRPHSGLVLELLEHRRQKVPHVVFARGRRRCR